MTQTNLILRLSSLRLASAAARVARGAGLAAFVMGATLVLGQNPAAPAPETHFTTPQGYTAHHTVDLGGRITGVTGSGAMYDTLVNLQTGPRVMGETFEMHALPSNKNPLVDTLTASGSGFGGDPYNFAKLDFSKGKDYDFSGIFRRDRQYFDYDLLANPNITTGVSIPIGPSATPTGSFAWPQVDESPVMFNTVRRMTDTTFTFHPLSSIVYRAGYSQNIFQGPTLSPGESVGKYDSLLSEYQRNSTDDFTGEVDWKPLPQTKLTLAEEIDHYKADSFFTLAPEEFLVQEADGTPVSMGNWDSQTGYSLAACNAAAMINPTQILYAPKSSGGRPVIDPACDVATSYLRSQPTRFLFPTEIFRFQSSSIPNVAMNGDFRYTNANMSLPSYYENFAGFDWVAASKTAPAYAISTITFSGNASAERQVVAADYGIVWQATKTVSLEDQFNFSNVHQPGIANITAGVTGVQSSTTAAGYGTIDYAGPLAPGSSVNVEGSPNGTDLPDYFGQKYVTNNATISWDATSRTTFAFSYRYQTHTIGEGLESNLPLAVGATNNGSVTIHQNGGILNAALRPTSNWNVNGSAELLYADNAFTPIGARQLQHYRVHTTYRPVTWATVSGAYNQYDRHNNTNNNQAAVAAGDDPYEGPLDHIDRSRVVSADAFLMPSDHVSFNLDYAYTDVYAATNICYNNGATATLPGTASTNAAGGPNVCPGVYARGSTTQLADWYARDYMDAPTHYGAAEVVLSPTTQVKTQVGYRIMAADGSEFFNDARAVNGSLNSKYDSPYFNVAWTVHPGLIWRAGYNFYGYGEGGPSGPQYCSTSTSTTSAVVPCTSLPYPTGLTESPDGLTAPRHFRANNLVLGVHYEF